MKVTSDIEIEFGASTDVGHVRENNEDSFRVAPEINLFVVSDGMGGQSSGEIASRLASEAVIAHCREAAENPALPVVGRTKEGASEFGNRLASAFRLANHAVHQAARRNAALHGMGATLVAVIVTEERLSIAHVGDSRAYRLRDGRLELLTEDHSFIAEQVRQGHMTEEEAQSSNLQNVLLRAVGVEEEVEVDLNEELFVDDDVLLLCSDGLTKELSDAQIAGVLATIEDADEASRRLIQLANDAGGNDNITVIVLRHAPRLVGSFEKLGRWFKKF
ncbi:MAG TPA: Stp1/IreP family PP2C-type Ser/Thr phosphatase [Candidatus Acidoferrales bacterium]|nr:Stp1/IreP family PP2C-type Ser/Thr phosphatase [Candidatus Acidoferrales bacterium]